jgi:hypothetical protein
MVLREICLREKILRIKDINPVDFMSNVDNKLTHLNLYSGNFVASKQTPNPASVIDIDSQSSKDS